MDGRDKGDGGDGEDGGGISRRHSKINQTVILGENLARSSSLSREIEIRGLFLLLPFLDNLFHSMLPINVCA